MRITADQAVFSSMLAAGCGKHVTDDHHVIVIDVDVVQL